MGWPCFFSIAGKYDERSGLLATQQGYARLLSTVIGLWHSRAVDIATLGASKYISLTTYRKDGTPVATPVWLVREGDTLRVVTAADSGKAKRLRNNTQVTVAPCDARGKLKGDAVAGTATLLDAAGTAQTEGMIEKRYGLLGRILLWRSRRAARKAGSPGSVGIEIRLA